MKINKDQVQKAALVGIFAIGAFYYYTSEMLGPLSKRADKAGKEIAELQKKVDEAKPKINRIRAVEAGDVNAEAAHAAYDVMHNLIPNSDPIAWVPTRLTELFRKTGVPKQSFRCNADPADLKFPGFKPACWSIELPDVEYASLGKALAELENQEGLIQITSLQLEASPKEPDHHHAQLTVSTLVKSNP